MYVEFSKLKNNDQFLLVSRIFTSFSYNFLEMKMHICEDMIGQKIIQLVQNVMYQTFNHRQPNFKTQIRNQSGLIIRLTGKFSVHRFSVHRARAIEPFLLDDLERFAIFRPKLVRFSNFWTSCEQIAFTVNFGGKNNTS